MNSHPSNSLVAGTGSTPPRGSMFGLLRGRGLSQSHERPPPPTASMLDGRPAVRSADPGSIAEATTPAIAAGRGQSYRIRLVPHIDTRRSLKFDPITRDLKEGETALRIGRANAHSSASMPGTLPQPHPTAGKVAFKSKVVSRSHAELWVGPNGQFFVRDTRSSSGTFLNRVRLSPANEESPAKPIKDGDVLQLGVDYQGGTEDIYKSVKMRVEVGREWQDGRNAFNTSAMKNLKTLSSALPKAGKTSIPDCCICLYSVRIHQALFIAPCSHTFHYKCMRPLVENHYPAFSCPLCRTFADLDDDVEIDAESDEEVEAEPVTDIEPAAPAAPDAIADHGEEDEDEDVMVGVVAPQPVDDVSMADVVQVKYTAM